MPSAPTYQTGKCEYDGKMPLAINSGVMTLYTAVANNGSFVAPCDLEIVQATVNVIVAPGTAAAALKIGTRAGATAFESYSIATSHALGAIDLPVSAFTTVNISKGDVVEFGTDGAATSTGDAAVTLVCIPR